MSEIEVLTPKLRRRLIGAGGVVAGIIGGIAVSVALMVMAASHGQSLWSVTKGAALPFLGRRVMAPGFDGPAVLLGLVCHFGISIIWGLLFALLAFGLSRPATVLLGAFWGIVVWLVMYYAVLPIVGAGAIPHNVPVVAAVVNHLIFGLGVGLGFLPYQRPHARPPIWGGRREAHARAA
jgi:hypothetical protein